MAPRMKQVSRGRGKAPISFNRLCFISPEAEARYNTFYSTKPLLPERGFDLRGKILEKVGPELEKRHWIEWAMQPIQAPVELVRQFYANLPEAQTDKVWLLGRWVSFSPETINRVLGIPHEEQHELYTGMRIDELAEFLCPNGTEWAIRNGRFRHFPRKDLSIDAQLWLYFVCARLLPAKHYSEITTDRCRVLYAILAGNPINVGKIIYRELLEVTDLKKSLPYPSLITMLSRAAGSEEGIEEMNFLDCLPPISDHTLSRITTTRARRYPPVEETSQRQRPRRSLEERVARLEQYHKYNMAMWKLWAEENNIPADRMPTFEASDEEMASADEASSSETE